MTEVIAWILHLVCNRFYSACYRKRTLYRSKPWPMTWVSASGRYSVNSTGQQAHWLLMACNYSARKRPASCSSGLRKKKNDWPLPCKRHRLWTLPISRIAAVTCSLKSCATGHRRNSSITASSSVSVKPQLLQTWKHWPHGCKKIIYPF